VSKDSECPSLYTFSRGTRGLNLLFFEKNAKYYNFVISEPILPSKPAKFALI